MQLSEVAGAAGRACAWLLTDLRERAMESETSFKSALSLSDYSENTDLEDTDLEADSRSHEDSGDA